MHESLEIFCCYARKDQPLLLKLRTHLASLGLPVAVGQKTTFGTSFVLSAELGDVIILINNKLSLGSYIR